MQSACTVSQQFHHVLNAVLRLHSLLLAKPVPILADSSCARWKLFEGCLGTLDGTYIDVRVPAEDRARYRIRKGSVSVNVLVVCDREMRFLYVLAGWESNYYLVDSGYRNGEGFLSPYQGIRRGSGDEEFREYLGTVDSNSIWNTWRDEMAKSMNNEWRGIP
ncbi:UNVERIFIED_CONTAM: hypothetical protein Slati_3001200 [Sesamum latifolium]|uniref:DDE Tnp4 domain-containing protein n=1 Tax=Sesamum latifolium TaxID=2727402 RepID=A0AAW2VH36_9LAMI